MFDLAPCQSDRLQPWPWSLPAKATAAQRCRRFSELAWRDFYSNPLALPYVAQSAFKARIRCHCLGGMGRRRNNGLRPGAKARPATPLVDAAMLQLNQTGYMHNRLRMVSGCF